MFVGMGVLLIASRIGPAWCGWALTIAGLLYPAGRIGDVTALRLLTDVVLLSAIAPIAAATWQGRDMIRR
jgi:hypothetical protein